MEDKEKWMEKFFDIYIQINDYILKKSENEELTFIDHYMFQATSYLISILHDNLLLKEQSYNKCFIYRSLIEVITIMKMYLAGDVPTDAEELINSYNYIAEYNIYKRYKSVLDKKEFNFEEIENNFKNTKSMYREVLNDINSSKFKDLLNSKLPFLKDDFTFDSLIQKYSPGFYSTYRILSVMVHPNDLLLTVDFLGSIEFEVLEANIHLVVFDIIKKCYLNVKLSSTKTLREEISLISSNEINNLYLNMATAQKKTLFKLADMIEEKHNENTQSILFRELGKAVESMAIDKTFGFNEIVKCKFKIVIEMLALNYYISTLPHNLEDQFLEELVTKHTRLKLMEIYGIDQKEKLEDAYKCYMNYDKNISFEEFKKKFFKSLGFVPGDISITKFVFNFIDALTKDNQDFGNHMKMVYDESQFLSHANGYMISSNSGAFMDYSSVIIFTDVCIEYIIELYYNRYKLYNESKGEHKYNKFIYDLNKCLKDYKKYAKIKNETDYKFKDFKVNYK